MSPSQSSSFKSSSSKSSSQSSSKDRKRPSNDPQNAVDKCQWDHTYCKAKYKPTAIIKPTQHPYTQPKFPRWFF